MKEYNFLNKCLKIKFIIKPSLNFQTNQNFQKQKMKKKIFFHLNESYFFYMSRHFDVNSLEVAVVLKMKKVRFLSTIVILMHAA